MEENRDAFSVTLRRWRTCVQLPLASPSGEIGRHSERNKKCADKFPRRLVDSSFFSGARRGDGNRENPLESTARSTMDPGIPLPSKVPRLTFRSFIKRGTRAADVASRLSNEISAIYPRDKYLSAITTLRRKKSSLLPPPRLFPQIFVYTS